MIKFMIMENIKKLTITRLRLNTIFHELLIFGEKQASACIFGGFLLAIMLVTNLWYPFETIHRYDFIFIAAIIFQITLILTRLETPKEALVILLFHIVATIMELFKTSDAIASWQYPEEYYFGISNVPLFTGFMYSAVGSYIARVWRIFEFRYEYYPNKNLTIVIVILIYANFFTHHYIYDIRWYLIAIVSFVFIKTKIHFRIINTHRNMPLLLGWFLVSIFIWFAENIATYANIWIYPNQSNGWKMVPVEKLSSWFLLMLLSFVLVALINHINVSNDKSA